MKQSADMHINLAYTRVQNGVTALLAGRHKIIILLMLASAALSVLQFDTFQVGNAGDDAIYIILATSLASGRGYRLINFPEPPIEPAFPPGWPLLLTPLTVLFPENLTAFKLLSLAFWLASIPLAYRLFKYYLRSPYLEATTALIALNPTLVHWSKLIMSENAYLFFSLLTLNLFESWRRQTTKGGRWWLFGGFMVAALATLIVRTVGVTLLAALLLYLLLNYGRRYLGILGGALILALIPVAWFNYRNGGVLIFSESYSQHVAFVSSHFLNYLQVWNYYPYFYWEGIASLVVPVFDLQRVATLLSPELNRFLSISTLLVVLLGFLLSLRRYETQDFYVALYAGLFYFWIAYTNSQGHQQRLVSPVIPFMYFYLVLATSWVTDRLGRNRRKITIGVTLGAVGLILLMALGRNFHEWRNPVRNRITDLSIGTTWLNDNSPSDTTVMTTNPELDYLYAKRQTVPYPPYEVDMKQYLTRYNIDYVIVKPDMQTPRSTDLTRKVKSKVLPFIESNPNLFRQVFRDSDHNVTVYQVMTP